MNYMKHFLLILAFVAACHGRTLHVGPEQQYKLPSEAAAVAANGDTVAIDAGVYEKDACNWTADNLVIRGVGGRAHMKCGGVCAGGKAIWVIKGKNTTVENIEFSEAKVEDKNGAGIRQEGDGLTVRNCYFHHCEMGVLTGKSATSDIYFYNSEFAWNGYGDGYSHNIYIGNVRSFTMKFCYSHHSKIGHNVKSRANNNFIMYNRITDEMDGESSMNIDLPNGGVSYIVGNMIMQGPLSENTSIVTYGLEGLSNPDNRLYVVNNTFVNRGEKARYIVIQSGAGETKVINNIFAGNDAETEKIVVGTADTLANVRRNSIDEMHFVDEPNYDYHITIYSPALDAGVDPQSSSDGRTLFPLAEYKHPLDSLPRFFYESIDAGAYEFGNPDEVEENSGPAYHIHLIVNGESYMVKTDVAPENPTVLLYNCIGERIDCAYSVRGEAIVLSGRLQPGAYYGIISGVNGKAGFKVIVTK